VDIHPAARYILIPVPHGCLLSGSGFL